MYKKVGTFKSAGTSKIYAVEESKIDFILLFKQNKSLRNMSMGTDHIILYQVWVILIYLLKRMGLKEWSTQYYVM